MESQMIVSPQPAIPPPFQVIEVHDLRDLHAARPVTFVTFVQVEKHA